MPRAALCITAAARCLCSARRAAKPRQAAWIRAAACSLAVAALRAEAPLKAAWMRTAAAACTQSHVLKFTREIGETRLSGSSINIANWMEVSEQFLQHPSTKSLLAQDRWQQEMFADEEPE